jgi:putative tRNA adenosine deaminase-associated protein
VGSIVAYFAAVLTRSADRWEARDVDLDDIEDVAGLLHVMRETSEDEDFEPESALLLLEQEDLWFAVIRTDVDEDPRVFVSDFTAAGRSAYAELLFAAGLLPVSPDGRRLGSPDADLDELAVLGGRDEDGEPVRTSTATRKFRSATRRFWPPWVWTRSNWH